MPDNSVYYHIAYMAATVVYTVYALRLSMKWKKLRAQRAKLQS